MPCELEGPPFRRHRLTEKTIVVEDGGGEVVSSNSFVRTCGHDY